GPPGRFARSLDRRQQQSDQDADDRDHNQQFDERKRPRARRQTRTAYHKSLPKHRSARLLHIKPRASLRWLLYFIVNRGGAQGAPLQPRLNRATRLPARELLL